AESFMPLDTAIAGDEAETRAAVAAWLTRLEAAVAAGTADALADMFAPDAHWRDVVALTWTIRTTSGAQGIGAALADSVAAHTPRGFIMAPGRVGPRRVQRAGVDCIEALFAFETAHGNGSGVVRLRTDADGSIEPRAWIVATTLDDLAKHGITEGQSIAADAFSRDFGGENWKDKRDRRDAFAESEPAVVVVGAGQAGLGLAARLTALGVDTLLIDAHARIGDNWRKRYHSLTLHNEVHVNHLPFLPFPKTFPVFIPKDKLANWFESYADIMDIATWTSTRLASGSYDDDTERWMLELDQGDRGTRVVRPRHVVFATGVSSIPVTPNLPGLSDFAGTVMHSAAYTDGADWAGRRALVIGTGNSAHDVAQDLHASGAHVMMVQRASSYIVSLA
ncbi:MAG: FAD-dependent oxidoreductase, partial [Pseudomonadota bacterium]